MTNAFDTSKITTAGTITLTNGSKINKAAATAKIIVEDGATAEISVTAIQSVAKLVVNGTLNLKGSADCRRPDLRREWQDRHQQQRRWTVVGIYKWSTANNGSWVKPA